MRSAVRSNGTSQEPIPENARKDGHIEGRSKQFILHPGYRAEPNLAVAMKQAPPPPPPPPPEELVVALVVALVSAEKFELFMPR